jgi:1-phosphatidylinositol-4-phosphate 5-kinase
MSQKKQGLESRLASLALRRTSAQTASTSGQKNHQKRFPNGDTYSGGWCNGLPEGEGRYCWADGSTYEGGWRVMPHHPLLYGYWIELREIRFLIQHRTLACCYVAKYVKGNRYWRRMDQSMGSAYTHGRTEQFIKGNGRVGACMVSARSNLQMALVTRYCNLFSAELARRRSDCYHPCKPIVCCSANFHLLQGGWANDLKHGLGKKMYANGDVYEGLWKLGKCEGPGRYRWKNKNEYDGEWRTGRMHGKGTLKWNTGLSRLSSLPACFHSEL